MDEYFCQIHHELMPEGVCPYCEENDDIEDDDYMGFGEDDF